eukprot:349877-Chlamydomonas_euryale.AAC.2
MVALSLDASAHLKLQWYANASRRHGTRSRHVGPWSYPPFSPGQPPLAARAVCATLAKRLKVQQRRRAGAAALSNEMCGRDS